jgi:hypothetical protein
LFTSSISILLDKTINGFRIVSKYFINILSFYISNSFRFDSHTTLFIFLHGEYSVDIYAYFPLLWRR